MMSALAIAALAVVSASIRRERRARSIRFLTKEGDYSELPAVSTHETTQADRRFRDR